MIANGQSEGLPEWGYRFEFSASGSGTIHHFCGPSDIPGSACPNCSKPLQRLLSLDAQDAHLELDPARHPFVHLLYCWTCSIPFGIFSYRITANGGVELIEVPPKHEYEFGPDGPYDGFTGEFAYLPVTLRPLSSEEQANQRARFSSDLDTVDDLGPAHQIGGYPMIQNPEKTFCPICSIEMPFLAAFCDDATGNNPNEVKEKNSFTGNCGVQMVFNFCRKCSVVSAYHSND